MGKRFHRSRVKIQFRIAAKEKNINDPPAFSYYDSRSRCAAHGRADKES